MIESVQRLILGGVLLQNEQYSFILPIQANNLEKLKLSLGHIVDLKLVHSDPVIDQWKINASRLLPKVLHRINQVKRRDIYQNHVALLQDFITQNKTDLEMEGYLLLASQKRSKLIKRKEEVKKVLSLLNSFKSKMDRAYIAWKESTQKENKKGLDPKEALEDAEVTEPLLCSPDLLAIIRNHLGVKAEDKIGRIGVWLLQKIGHPDTKEDILLLNLQDLLQEQTKILVPKESLEILDSLKTTIKNFLEFERLLIREINLFVERGENIEETDSEDTFSIEEVKFPPTVPEAHSEKRMVTKLQRNSEEADILRKLSCQEEILKDAIENCNLDPGQDISFLSGLISSFNMNLLELSSITGYSTRFVELKKILCKARHLFPSEKCGDKGMKLKLKSVSLPSFSGKESDYFSFKSELLDLLANSCHDISAQCRAVKSDCFKTCPNILALIKNCKSIDDIFVILDERLGKITRHADRIIREIDKFPPANESSKSIVQLCDFILRINVDIEGANALLTVANFQTCSKIKSKFSPLMARDFVKRFGSSDEQDCIAEWGNLLDFLREERTTALNISAFENSVPVHPSKPNFTAKVNLVTPSTKVEKCPLCSGNHFAWSFKCPKTREGLSPDTRSLMKKIGLCFTCMIPGCKKTNCSNTRFACKNNCLQNGKALHSAICDCVVSRNLHNEINPKVSVNACNVQTNNSNLYSVGTTLMLFEHIVIIDPKTNVPRRVKVTYDQGASDTISSKSVNCWGKENAVIRNLKIDGFNSQFKTDLKSVKQLSFKLKTINGLVNLETIQVDQLNVVTPCEVSIPFRWSKFFPSKSQKVGGATDFLLGGNAGHLFPTEVDRFIQGKETLILYKSKITGRYLIYGRNKKMVKFSGKPIPSVNRMNLIPGNHDLDLSCDQDFVDTHDLDLQDKLFVDDCFETMDEIDVVQCFNYNYRLPAVVQKTVLAKLEEQFFQQLTCETADNDHLAMTNHAMNKKIQEEEILKAGITYDAEKQRWNVKYAYTENIKKLQTNFEHVHKRMINLNMKLTKRPDLCCKVNSEIKKNLENKFWIKSTDVEFPDGMQKHFLPINYVESAASTSTPVRIVTDSSSKDRNGLSLNQCQLSGRSNIGNLRGCLLRARVAQQIALGDISKFFNSFSLNVSDASLRRILLPKYGFGGPNEFEEYCQVCVPFGDKAAGILSVMGRDKNVDQFALKAGPELAELVKFIFQENTYIDDVTAVQSWSKPIREVIDGLELVAASGNLKFKNWRFIGDPGESKYLGYTWDSENDMLQPKSWFNMGKVLRGVATEDDLNLENVEDRIMASFTKRDALSLQGQFFDPLMILSPLVVKLRLFYGGICLEKNPDDWNSQLSTKRKQEFIQIFKEIAPAQRFKFPRSTIPRNCIQADKPDVQLICFTDGSLSAYACAVYIRLFTNTGEIHAQLLTSGVKTVGNRTLTAPRTELLGAVLGVQTTTGVLQEIKSLVNVKNTYYFTDSRVVLGQLLHPSGKFELFIGSRIDYIQRCTQDASWRWIPGDSNPADLPTRGSSNLQEVMSDKWLHGGFLLQQEDQWPAKNIDSFTEELPGLDKPILQASMLIKRVHAEKETQYVEPWKQFLDNHSNMSKVSTILGHCLKFKYPMETLAQRRAKALAVLLQQAMPLSEDMKRTHKFHDVAVEEQDGLIIARGRTLESLKGNKLIVLSEKSAIAKLIFRDFHERFGHLSSVKKVQSKILEQYYIPRSAKPLSQIKTDCMLCRKLIAMPEVQRMGDLKRERFEKSKPFSHILIDCLGPLQAFDAVKKRTTTKVWALVASCCYTRAVWVTALENYSADAVISALSRIKARFGQFQTVYSDFGTNLTAAGRLDSTDEEGTVFDGKIDFAKQFPDVTWKTGVPKAPWFMGGVECFVKQVKTQLRILRVQEGVHKLTHLEWETLFAKISSIINERPLICVPEPGNTICANDLLYGHNGNVPLFIGPQESSLTKRSQAIQQNLQTWWSIYHSHFLKVSSSILKWKEVADNLEVNDIVLLLDSPNKVGSYKVGRIVQVYPDGNGLVRNVQVEYRTSQQNRLVKVDRHCRTLTKLTHQTTEFNEEDDRIDLHVDDVDDVDDNVDVDHDVVDDLDDVVDVVVPHLNNKPPVQVKYSPTGAETILDIHRMNKGKR